MLQVGYVVLLFLFIQATLQVPESIQFTRGEGGHLGYLVVPHDSGDIEYELVAKIGDGSSGNVYSAYNHTYGRYEAIKEIEADEDFSGNELDNLGHINGIKELRTYIIQVYFSVSDRRETYLFMELADYSLEDLLKNNDFVQRNYARIWNAILSVMYALHSSGIQHGEANENNFVVVLEYKHGKVLHLLKAIDFQKSQINRTYFSTDMRSLAAILKNVVDYYPGLKNAIGGKTFNKIFQDFNSGNVATSSLLSYQLNEPNMPREAAGCPNLILVEVGEKPQNKKASKQRGKEEIKKEKPKRRSTLGKIFRG